MVRHLQTIPVGAPASITVQGCTKSQARDIHEPGLEQEASEINGLLRGSRAIDHPRQPRLPSGGVILVNNALFSSLIQTFDGNLKPLTSGFDVACFKGHINPFRAFTNAALDFTIALAALETLSITFQCRFVRSQPNPPVFWQRNTRRDTPVG